MFSLRIAMTIGRGIVPSSSIELVRLLVFVSLMHTGYAQDQRRPAPGMQVTYLGTAGWEIADGNTVILVDPYLSRIPGFEMCCGYDRLLELLRPAGVPAPSRPSAGSRQVVRLTDELITDTATVDKHIRRADFILITHSHVDHIMDVPYIARKTGATVIGASKHD